MNNPFLDNPTTTIKEESRIANYEGFVQEAVHLVSFDKIEITVLGVSHEEQSTSVKSISRQNDALSQAFAAAAKTEIKPTDQIIVLPIEGGTAGGSPTEGCELSTEIILSYLDHAIGEDQLTRECNLKCDQIFQDIENLQFATTELDKLVKKNALAIRLQSQIIDNLRVAVSANTSDIADNATAIAALDITVQKNKNAIAINEQNIAALQSIIADNTHDISALSLIVHNNVSAINSLESSVASNSARITANASLISENATNIQELFILLENLSDRVGENSDAISILRVEFDGYKAIVDKNTQDIQDILNLIGSDDMARYQEGFGTDGEEITLDPNWTAGKPYLDVKFAYGTSNLGYVISEQEVICGHSGIFPTVNEGEYKFKLFNGLYEVGPVNPNAMNFTPPMVTAAAPEGTVVYTDESAVQTTVLPSAMLRIKGSINIANSGPAGSAGQITLQINVDDTEWVDIDTLFMYFSSTDATGVDKIIDKAFTFEQVSHTYKLRGKLVLKTAPNSNLYVDGSIAVNTVIERGTGVKLSSNVFAKWIAKD